MSEIPSYFEELTEPFSKATGLPLQFHPPGQFSVAGTSRIPSFCRVMESSRRACERCQQIHLGLQSPEGTRTSVCFAGLTSSAVPVRRTGEVLGYFHTGHVYVDRKRGCARPGKGCFLPGPKNGHCPCVGACLQTPSFARERYEGAVELVGVLASQAAALYEPKHTGAPYPAVDRAVAMVRGDILARWKVASLARKVGMHPTYFSEKFRERTGQSFTKYLASLRVERAEGLLRYTHLPVSEIAFASGFRSLSQFNRTFKSVTGHAPCQTKRGR